LESKQDIDSIRKELERVSPGTELRAGIDQILSARTGALIVIGDTECVASVCNGGFAIDIPLSAQRLSELSKMDGAIIVSEDMTTIRRANVHLVPDSGLHTCETGMRHRTAERVSQQTGAFVISVSQRRNIVSVYCRGTKVVLDDIDVLLAKANAALQTLQRYRIRLDEKLEHLTALELKDAVTMAELTEVIKRFEMVRRISREVGLYISKLGSEGRLTRMQLEEITVNLEDEYAMLIRDYAADSGSRKVAGVASALAGRSFEQLAEPSSVAHALQLASDIQSSDDLVRPRGFRALRRIPHLPLSVIGRVLDRFGTLADLLMATTDDLDQVDGVGTRRAKAITDGLSGMRDRLER